ncbi:MAG: hypothetical protein M5U09_20620 [Gammaproteobacteria bacterium]|nr:hypothetical protein [Gammaproteobacteria bacterium]
MIAGIVLIVAGLLIAVYPPLLAWIVALVLVAVGALVLSSAYYHRKYARHADNPVIELIYRY